ncbi:hypothetical protein OsJ_31764 [Oryza sativa Japonica Group]|uniref:Uncharacterized protein n=1 Tax=Oryza sativa subsp. japonica TaxID=39947 RepID=B9G622_ORYSJ|nr:hypothetical protein OsJ_31764 [Oryza sativa Japonica Group]
MAAVMLRALGNGAPDVMGERRGRDGERRGDERDGPDDERGDFLVVKYVLPRNPLSCCSMITTAVPPMNPGQPLAAHSNKISLSRRNR